MVWLKGRKHVTFEVTLCFILYLSDLYHKKLTLILYSYIKYVTLVIESLILDRIQKMKKKPDVVARLVLLFVVGLLISGLAKTASVDEQHQGSHNSMVTSPEMGFELPEDFE